jgi:hypothetical protein
VIFVAVLIMTLEKSPTLATTPENAFLACFTKPPPPVSVPDAVFDVLFDKLPTIEVIAPDTLLSAILILNRSPTIEDTSPASVLFVLFVKPPAGVLLPPNVLFVAFVTDPPVDWLPDKTFFASFVNDPTIEVIAPDKSLSAILIADNPPTIEDTLPASVLLARLINAPVIVDNAPDSVLLACFASVPTTEDNAPLVVLLACLDNAPLGVIAPLTV